MSLRPTLPRLAVLPLSSILMLAALALVGCGGGSSPSGPSSNAPILTSITPSTGTSFGGTQVTISGDRFVVGATVSFGGVPATNIAVENATTIRATTPPHASGAVDIQVSGSTGTATLGQGFTFVAPGGTNNPPAIKSLTAKGRKTNEPLNFADVGETIDLTAIVEDAETPVDKLSFQWTASTGTVNGNGPVVTWAAPSSATTPVDVTITLTVVETYKAPDASGLPVDKENRASTTTSVSLHNSAKEVGNMAEDFLVTFSNSSIGPDTVLRDFAPTSICPGAAAERDDVIKNRATRKITNYSVGTATVTLNFAGSCPFRGVFGDACASVPVSWESTVLVTTDPNYGKTEVTSGVDQVTGVYANKRWYLCASDYDYKTLTYK